MNMRPTNRADDDVPATGTDASADTAVPPRPPTLRAFMRIRTVQVLSGLAVFATLGAGYIELQTAWLPWLELWMIPLTLVFLVAVLAVLWLVGRHRYAGNLEQHLRLVQEGMRPLRDKLDALENEAQERESEISDRNVEISDLKTEIQEFRNGSAKKRAQRDVDLVESRLGGLKERQSLRRQIDMEPANWGYSQDQVDELHDIQHRLGESETVEDPNLREALENTRSALELFLVVFDSMGDSSDGPQHVRPLDPDRQQIRWNSPRGRVQDAATGAVLDVPPEERSEYLAEHPNTLFADISTLLRLQQEVREALKVVESRAHVLRREWDLN